MFDESVRELGGLNAVLRKRLNIDIWLQKCRLWVLGKGRNGGCRFDGLTMGNAAFARRIDALIVVLLTGGAEAGSTLGRKCYDS